MLSAEKRNYRKVAQEWYGLTDEQMEGMDVHHNPPVHKGGRNVPEHLFVYHPTLHVAVHDLEFIKWARAASALAHQEKDERGRSLVALKMLAVRNARKDERGKCTVSVENANKMHAEKDEQGRSLVAVRAGKAGGKKGGPAAAAMRWMDPDHPELGTRNAGALANLQKARGYPHGPGNRIRVS